MNGRRVVGMLEAPSTVHGFGEPVKLTSKDAVRLFLGHVRESIKPGAELTRMLFEPGFRKEFNEMKLSYSDRLVRDGLLKKIEQAGGSLVLKAPLNNEEVRLIAKFSLGGGQTYGSVSQKAADAMFKLIGDWSIGKTGQLASLQRGLIEKHLMSVDVLYARVLEGARRNLENIALKGIVPGSGRWQADFKYRLANRELLDLERKLYGSRGNIEETIKKYWIESKIKGPNLALEAYQKLSEEEKVALSAYTMIASRYPQIMYMSEKDIPGYLNRILPKGASYGDLGTLVKYWTSGASSWLSKEWIGRTHLPVTKRWGVVVLGLAALAAAIYEISQIKPVKTGTPKRTK